MQNQQSKPEFNRKKTIQQINIDSIISIARVIYKISMWLLEKTIDKVKDLGNDILIGTSNLIYSPPEAPQFEKNGELSPGEFAAAGDKLTEVCTGWKWMPSLNLGGSSKYFQESKQYLVLQQALCRKRLDSSDSGTEQKIVSQDGDEVILLHSDVRAAEEFKEEEVRYYNMYIVYDEHYHTPRMFFSAMDYEGKPLSYEDIKQDIQKEYIDKTLSVKEFPFLENTSMPTVHPCKHANVLKTMSDAMRENGQKVDAHFALLIFLKFITSVVPTVEFDITGDLIFS